MRVFRIILGAVCALAVSLVLAAPLQASPERQSYYAFNYPHMVGNYMEKYLNEEPQFYGVHHGRYTRQVVPLTGYYLDDTLGNIRFTAHLHKVGRTTVLIELYFMGMKETERINVGFNL